MLFANCVNTKFFWKNIHRRAKQYVLETYFLSMKVKLFDFSLFCKNSYCVRSHQLSIKFIHICTCILRHFKFWNWRQKFNCTHLLMHAIYKRFYLSLQINVAFICSFHYLKPSLASVIYRIKINVSINGKTIKTKPSYAGEQYNVCNIHNLYR